MLFTARDFFLRATLFFEVGVREYAELGLKIENDGTRGFEVGSSSFCFCANDFFCVDN